MKALALALALFGAAFAKERTVSLTLVKGCINVGVAPFCQGIGNGTRHFSINSDTMHVDAGFQGDSDVQVEIPGCARDFFVWSNVTGMIFGEDNCLYTQQSEFMHQCCTDPTGDPVINPYFSCYGPDQSCLSA